MTDCYTHRLFRIGALCIVWLLSMLLSAVASDIPVAGRVLVVTIGLSTIYGGVLAVGIIGVWQGWL